MAVAVTRKFEKYASMYSLFPAMKSSEWRGESAKHLSGASLSSGCHSNGVGRGASSYVSATACSSRLKKPRSCRVLLGGAVPLFQSEWPRRVPPSESPPHVPVERQLDVFIRKP